MSIIETMANYKGKMYFRAGKSFLNVIEKMVDKEVDNRNKMVEELNSEMSSNMTSISKINKLMNEIDDYDKNIRGLIKSHDDMALAMNYKCTLLSDVYVGILK